MSLKERITDDMKTAMRAKDSERLGTIRLLQSAMKQKEVDERIELDDAAIVAIVDKMIKHARSRTSKFALYFETGQGADFTNGHGKGLDMVLLESRKYGFARSLAKTVADENDANGVAQTPWVHLNDVAGFIGPEVFRSREQLVRCCLEDIVMGKLHGLMIGLDICTTLHMDVTLDDLGWCIDEIMPANPGYLMALPTRIDPMLGYLTTSFHDHVHMATTSNHHRTTTTTTAFTP